MKTKINLDYIKKFNPCKSGIDRFIKEGYENFDGSIIEFLNLKGILFSDKKWVLFNDNQNILSNDLMREFALICALRAVERVNIPEITYLYDIALLEYISGERIGYAERYAAYYTSSYAAHSAAHYAAYYAAHSAAHYAAYYASSSAADSVAHYTEEEIQKEILIHLIENGTTLKPPYNVNK